MGSAGLGHPAAVRRAGADAGLALAAGPAGGQPGDRAEGPGGAAVRGRWVGYRGGRRPAVRAGPGKRAVAARVPAGRAAGGPGRLDALLALVPGRAAGPAAAPRLFSAADLPHLASTRDSRDRLDL